MKNRNLALALVTLALVALAVAASLRTQVGYFEDGSFSLVGCLPWLVCALG
jgi:hypothetical protein